MSGHDQHTYKIRELQRKLEELHTDENKAIVSRDHAQLKLIRMRIEQVTEELMGLA